MKQIYGLIGDEPHRVVYVGCATDAKKRVNSHWKQRNSKYRNLVKNWLLTLAEPPDFYVFEEVPDDLANDAEEYYTKVIREMGIKLLNVLDGRAWRDEPRQSLSMSMKGMGVGKKSSPETCQKISEKLQGNKNGSSKIIKCPSCELVANAGAIAVHRKAKKH